ncbi:hypothetical protein I8752_33435 [Nostocaceae cyanobacterium CENA369]|uniref:Uncharacterized protein n=1 Tax=Dendronalium phyllosphericum CENA369 TaxID=1725256 RepID=A0A8J7LJL1_9NOST|nr:hypothetical protein [Dendronalium phyllosphericum]MBH8577783.1 hypothetical protein [Dendronalium phyllosphericum CENA369]
MFTRTELETRNIKELKELCQRYSIKPVGNQGYKTTLITALMAFPRMALIQMENEKGLRHPTFADVQNIGEALDRMGSPTDEQIALIRASLEGRRMDYPYRYQQERLMQLYKAKLLLEELVNVLGT